MNQQQKQSPGLVLTRSVNETKRTKSKIKRDFLDFLSIPEANYLGRCRLVSLSLYTLRGLLTYCWRQW